jgi:DNA-binding YbaB/EbfC family protein
MFQELGAVMNLLKNKAKLQEEMGRFQQVVGQITAEGTAGAGYVTVRVNGRMELVSCRLSDEALKLGDREMLEDLIVAATNQAMVKVREQLAAETAKVATGLGLPPGMLSNLPGMG